MGAITALASGTVAFVIVAAYLFMRVMPTTSRMLATPQRRQVEKNKEDLQTKAGEELNAARREHNTYAEALHPHEDKLAAKQRSNDGLDFEKDRWKATEMEVTGKVKELEQIVKDVVPDAKAGRSRIPGQTAIQVSDALGARAANPESAAAPRRHGPENGPKKL